ncbi:hypothetical protein SASPL_156172 [Salvia splendens]|uniref:Nodulin homeobox N-terminal domain-containing protein n=1 Tax=Salvia splendens TaxID=180675 RepID=A0A8X8VX56_SALSN|nr:hypothetical protein SASPL_156172 [Salvia splendens]
MLAIVPILITDAVILVSDCRPTIFSDRTRQHIVWISNSLFDLTTTETTKSSGAMEAVLILVQAVMNLKLSGSDNISSYMAAISRLKSKALSILLKLCEAESVSYLDEVASNTTTHNMTKLDSRYWLQSLRQVFLESMKSWLKYEMFFSFIRKMEPRRVMDPMLVSRVRIFYIMSLLARSPELQSIKVSPVERFLEKPNNGRSRSSSRGSSLGRSPVHYDSSSRNMLVGDQI